MRQVTKLNEIKLIYPTIKRENITKHKGKNKGNKDTMK